MKRSKMNDERKKEGRRYEFWQEKIRERYENPRCFGHKRKVRMTWKKKVSSTLLQLTFDITWSIQKQEQILDWMESKRRALGMRLQRDDGIRKGKWMEETKEGFVSLDFFFEYRILILFRVNKSNFCILSL